MSEEQIPDVTKKKSSKKTTKRKVESEATQEVKNKKSTKKKEELVEEEVEKLDDLDIDDELLNIDDDDLDASEALEHVEDGLLDDMQASLDEDDDSKLLKRNALERLRLTTDKTLGSAITKIGVEILEVFRELEIYDLDTLRIWRAKDLHPKIKELGKLKGFGEKALEKIIHKAEELCGTKAFVPSTDVFVSETYIHTGSIALDNLLGGGIALGCSHEIFGSFGGGKTQISASVVCRSYLPIEMGGLIEEGKPPHYTIWIDSEETYVEMMRTKEIKEKIKAKAKQAGMTPAEFARGYVKKKEQSRMEKLCQGIGLNFQTDVRPYILHVPVDTVNQQLRRVEEANEYTSEYDVKVIILDSITKLIRQERSADEAYGQKISRTINVMLGHLNRLKTKCNAALICTNQAYSNMTAYGSKRFSEVSYGGGAVTHSLDKRIHVWESKGGVRQAELHDSCSLAAGEIAEFIITDAGIADVN